MIIQPGVEAPSVANMIELVRKDSLRRVDIHLQDVSGNTIDIDATNNSASEPKGELDLEVTDVAGNSIYSESYWPTDNADERRIKKLVDGKYYLKFGTEDNETDRCRSVLFNWHARQNISSEDVYRTQVVEIVSTRTLSLFPPLRLLIDKTVKPNLPEKYCYIGYTDGMLALFLKMGLHMINEAQPYPTFATLDMFPIEMFSNILLKAALYQGITSQLLFSIDTDIPNYSDSNHSFVLAHAQPLAGYIGHLKQELDAAIPNFKRHFVNSGTIGLEVRLDMAFAALLAASPPGALYRNLWSSG